MHRKTLEAIANRTSAHRIEYWANSLREQIDKQDKEYWPDHTAKELKDEPLIHLNRHDVMRIILDMYCAVSEARRLKKGSENRRIQRRITAIRER